MKLSHFFGRVARPACVLCVAVACTAAHPAAVRIDSNLGDSDSEWRRQVPASGKAPPLHVPVPQRRQLKNGLTVLHVHKPQLPLCHVSLVFKSGAAQDPRGFAGLASFTAEMLKMGTTQHSAAQLAEAVEALGTQIGVSVGEDAIMVSTTALHENIAAAFDLLVEQVRQPRFAAEEVDRLRKVRLAELAQRNFDPGSSAQTVLRQVLYGNHPYAHLPQGTAASVQRIKRAAVQHYFQEHFRPANAAVVVVGDLDDAAATQLIDAKLGDWQAHPEAPAGPQLPPEAPTEHRAGISLVARPGAPQSTLVVGELGAARDSSDFYALTLMNAILGGQFDSRINMNLREDKGYSYGARSSFEFLRQRGPFYIAAGVTSAATAPSLVEIFKEIDLLRDHDVRQDELRSAQNHFALSLPGKLQTVDSTAALLAGLFLYDLPVNYFAELPGKINAVQVADVRRVAQAYLRPEALSVVVVGDPSVVEVGLDGLGRGKVVRRDAEGRPVKGGRSGKLLPRKTP